MSMEPPAIPDPQPRSARSLDVRVGDAERERACALLAGHFQAGRLSADDFDERVEKAVGAVTARDLSALLADLPAERPAVVQAHPVAPVSVPSRDGLPGSDVLVLMVGLLAAICLVMLFVFVGSQDGPVAVGFFGALGGVAIGGASVHLMHRIIRRR